MYYDTRMIVAFPTYQLPQNKEYTQSSQLLNCNLNF